MAVTWAGGLIEGRCLAERRCAVAKLLTVWGKPLRTDGNVDVAAIRRVQLVQM